MRISDWSSDVCSSDLLNTSVRPSLIIVSTISRFPILWPSRRDWQCMDMDMLSCPPAMTMFASPFMIACTADATERSRSEEHTSELQSLMRISYAVFRLKKKKYHKH